MSTAVDIKYYDETYLAALLEITVKEFHREVKPHIRRSFKDELTTAKIDNFDIYLDKQKHMYLVDNKSISNYVTTNTSIFTF